METALPRPTRHHLLPAQPPTTGTPTPEAFRLPYTHEPQPHTFSTAATSARPAPPPAAAWQPSPYQQPAPRPQSQLPSIGIIWLNILVFGWFLGIGLISGVAKSIQGIVQSRNRGLSPAKYVLPLAAIAAVLVLLVIIGASVGHQGNTGGGYPYGN